MHIGVQTLEVVVGVVVQHASPALLPHVAQTPELHFVPGEVQ